MNNNNPPSIFSRIFSVWYRHALVYSRYFFSNAFPVLIDPLIFLGGLGLGLGSYIIMSDGHPYIEFLVPGMILAPAMFAAAFECSFGTFSRMEYQKLYDGMLGTPLTVNNILMGELLWIGTKGMFISFMIMVALVLLGIVSLSSYFFTPIVGFFTGILFGSLTLLYTSFVKTLNHLNFVMTGIISFFMISGVIFPLENIPLVIRFLAEISPLTHPVRWVRALISGEFELHLLWGLLYCLLVFVVASTLATRRYSQRWIV